MRSCEKVLILGGFSSFVVGLINVVLLMLKNKIVFYKIFLKNELEFF